MEKTSIALGFFDGVHIAHQKIIRAAVSFGRERGFRPIALTFDTAPVKALFGTEVKVISGNLEKQRLISALGAECVMLGATAELLAMDGESFVREVLVKKMNAAAVSCGYNYTFGSDTLGSRELRELGEKYGFEAIISEAETVDGIPVSSSRIRELLQKGDMEGARRLLGRNFAVTGIVEAGKRLGRTMGFPTVNIYPSENRCLIPRGVYAARVSFDAERRDAVTNVGVNPTVGDKNIRIETYIPGFSGNLYGKEITTEFVHFVRPERKFSSVEELFSRISEDAKTVAAYFEKTRDKTDEK